MKQTFSQDVEFLQQYTRTIVLGNPQSGAVVIAPQYQGRVMTSTTGGKSESSFGWINYDLIRSGELRSQINLYGGEERFWLAPEGGRFSIFFPPDPETSELNFADWRVPECIDTAAFSVVSQSETEVRFAHTASLLNRAGFEFKVGFDRRVRLLNSNDVTETLSCDPEQIASLNWVAHESHNTLVNRGDVTWSSQTGLLAIWVLCMNPPSPGATLIVPYRGGDEAKLGPIVNADYFGPLGLDRLRIDETRNQIYLLGDGEYRSKLGLTFARARAILGAWDRQQKVLTVVWFNLPNSVETSPDSNNSGTSTLSYVNNVWQCLADEFQGDAINGYNDGPNESGEKLGGFFELETLSPGLALAPRQSYTHIHRTIHLQASTPEQQSTLNHLLQRVFQITIHELESIFAAGDP